MVGVQGIDAELAQGRENALLTEWTDQKVLVNTFQLRHIHEAVRLHPQVTERDPLGGQADAHRFAGRSGCRSRTLALTTQIACHLAGQQLDQAAAVQGRRAALVGQLRVECVEIGVPEALRDEGIGNELSRPTRHRVVVTAPTGIGIRTRCAEEERQTAWCCLRRDNGAGSPRSTGALRCSELGDEQGATVGDERVRPQLCSLLLGQPLGHRLFQSEEILGHRIASAGASQADGQYDGNQVSPMSSDPDFLSAKWIPLYRTPSRLPAFEAVKVFPVGCCRACEAYRKRVEEQGIHLKSSG